MAYSVVIAEDFRMIREIFESAVQGARGYTLASSFMTAEDAVSYLSENEADLVLMDVLFPGSMNGLDAAAVIKEARPLTKIIIVTSMPELTYISRAKDIGVEGFWQKEIQEQPIREIMDRVMKGEIVYPVKTSTVAIGRTTSNDFTDREIEILRLLVAGASNKEIADALSVEASTIKMHISNMLKKTGYRSRLELAVKARHLGIAIND